MADCTKLVGMLRGITKHEWGTHMYCTMKINRMYIRTKLDYGCLVYGSACTPLLKSLDPVLNKALLVPTGAFCSTPVDSLRILTNEMSLECRRHFLLNYVTSIKAMDISITRQHDRCYTCIIELYSEFAK